MLTENTHRSRNSFMVICLAITLIICFSSQTFAKKAEIDENALQLRLLDMGYRNHEPVKDFYLFRMNGWSYVDKSHVLIRSSPKKSYMLRLKRQCYGLNFAHAIGLKTALKRVTKFDKIIVYDQHIPNYCYIDSIYKVDRIPIKERREYREEKRQKKLEEKQNKANKKAEGDVV